MEFTAVMKGWKMALSRSDRPSISPATKPLETPVTKPKKVFFSVTAVATHRLLSKRAMQRLKSPFDQPLNTPILDLRQPRTRKCSNISEGLEMK